MHHYISCLTEEENTTVKKTTYLLINQVWKLHELSNIIVSKRDSQFVSLVWKTICKILQIDVKLSTAFHLETDKQSEIVNQKMKRYLRNYCNISKMIDLNDYQWLNLLSMSSFLFQQNYSFLWQITNLNRECLSIHQRKLIRHRRESAY